MNERAALAEIDSEFNCWLLTRGAAALVLFWAWPWLLYAALAAVAALAALVLLAAWVA